MKTITSWIGLAALVLGLVAGVPSTSEGGQVIAYNNFGPNNSYNNFGAWFGTRPEFNDTLVVANRFIPTESGRLSEIWAGMIWIEGTNEVSLSLAVDANGLPGGVLWTQSFSNQLTRGFGSVLDTGGLNGPQLHAGTRYWLLAEGPSAGYNAWDMNNQAILDPWAHSYNGGPWEVASSSSPNLAMRIGVSAVTEPPTLFSGSLAVLAGLCYAWRRHGAKPFA